MANEKRLIDANALMDSFRSYMVEIYNRNKCTLEENCKTCHPGCLWRKKVMAAPTVDAEEVVRCKDCKHYNQAEKGCDYHGYYDHVPVDENDFCSYGEKREV